MRETNLVQTYNIDTLNMANWTRRIMELSHKAQYEQKAKHDRIVYSF